MLRELTDLEQGGLLTQQEVDGLLDGTVVMVKWSGGNGPHRYVVRRFGCRAYACLAEDADVCSDFILYPVGRERCHCRVFLPDKEENTVEVDLWGPPNAERLLSENRDEALELLLEELEELPDTIKIAGYRRAEITHADVWAADTLERLLEALDEEYGDPDEATKASIRMIEASKAFVRAVIDEYTVWHCEQVHEETVDVKVWVQERRPGWLERVSARCRRTGIQACQFCEDHNCGDNTNPDKQGQGYADQ